MIYGSNTFFATGDTFRVVNSGISENIIWAKANAEVELYYNNSMKFETTNTGVYVNGNVVVTGTVDGRDVATDGTKLDGIESNATADQTASEILTLIKTVDGSGSGLDADLLDGISSASFLRSDAVDSSSENITINGLEVGSWALGATYRGLFHTSQSGSEYILISQDEHTFISASSGYNVYIRNGGNDATNQLIVGSGNNALTWRGNKIFHAGNDGSGSNLDSDLLDGQHGSYYANASNLNAGTVAAARLSTATTQSAGNNTTKIATTAFVSTAINNLINGAPAALDTLNELAAAMNDNASFSTTVTNSLATKMPLAGGQFTGNITFSGSQTVDGRDLSVDGSKLDGIESGATADQSASEILTLIKTVDGAGSGLDADTLDGISSGSFVRSDANDSFNNTLTWSGTAGNMPVDFATNDGYPSMRVIRNNASSSSPKSDGLYIGYSNSNNGVTRIYGGGATTGALTVNGASDVRINGSTVFHAGNDGSGSGLDADTLDGVQGASFLRSDATDTASGAITFTSSNLQLSGHYYQGYHSSGQNYIHFYPADPSNNAGSSAVTTDIRAWNGSSFDVLRIQGGNNTITWRNNTIFHSGNDGSGSGLDADTVDGIQASSFLRSDANDNASGDIVFDAAKGIRLSHGNQQDTNDGFISAGRFDTGLNIVGTQTTAGTGRQVRFWGEVLTNGGDKFWNAGNDGSGSGLDSDKLDGQEGSYYRNASNLNAGTIPAARVPTLNQNTTGNAATASDAALLDGLDSSQFLRSDNSDVMTGNFTLDGNFTMSAGHPIIHNSTPTRDKIRLWTSSNYAIGMDNAMTFGGLNDYAMTFQMNNESDRGWVFLDDSHTDAQGAMSLTTQGKMALAHSLRLAYGESDTTTPGASYRLDVNGTGQFLGDVTIGDGSGNTKLLLKKVDNNASDHLQFYNGTTRVGEIGVEDTTWLRINQETAKNIYTPRYIRADNGFFVDGTSKGINGSGNFIGGTIAGASDYSTLLRSDTADTASGDITFSGGGGAVTIAANSDIRFTNGNWTGNSGTTPKIQAHSNYLYIVGGSSGIIFREDGTDRWFVDGSGHFRPATNNTYDIGNSSHRVRNLYVNDAHFSNEGSSNSIDGTWGDWTLQEGEDDIFMINNRSGKKFKIAMTPV